MRLTSALNREGVQNSLLPKRLLWRLPQLARRGLWQNHRVPYEAHPKISHRAWFSPEEYKQLYEATKARARAEAGALSNGNASSFTTVCCSPPIQASGPMRRGASNFGT